MVLASILVFWAYGRGVSFRSTRTSASGTGPSGFGHGGRNFCLDVLLGLSARINTIRPCRHIRKASHGIGWIFQFGMGYTFYLPFALYMAGLLCWSYTVIKLLTMGRLAGYGLGLMFIAGYALLVLESDVDGRSRSHVVDAGPLPARCVPTPWRTRR